MLEFLISFLVTCTVMPLLIVLLRRAGTIDTPNQRSSHSIPTLRGGGLACMLGVALAFGVGSLAGHQFPWLAGGAAISFGLLGFLDDRRSLPPMVRLVAQVTMATIAMVAFAGGWWILAGGVAILIAVNVVNFMDGINGMTSLNLGLWGITAGVLGASYGVPELLSVGAVTAGAALGFFPWNAPSARIFLGDAGSYLFGALVGLGCLIGIRGGISPVLLVAPMTLYLADCGTTLMERLVHGDSLLQAHRDHVYQRLVLNADLPHIAVSGLTTALAAIITLSWVPRVEWLGLVVTTVVVVVYLLLPRLLRPRTTPPVLSGLRFDK